MTTTTKQRLLSSVIGIPSRLKGIERAVLGGMFLGEGLVREVRHRNHTRSYALTQAGKAFLAQEKE